MRKRIAFTLAEVLITLGVIGVVAAMTMPTLIANYQKKVWVNQLKKSVSTLEQGFHKMLADDGVDSLENTKVFSAINSRCIATYGVDDDGCKNFHKEIQKYFKVTSIQETGSYKFKDIKKTATYRYPDNRTTGAMIHLADGMILMMYNLTPNEQASSYSCDFIKAHGGHMCARMGNISIDVNGTKGPNIQGRDMFNFNISSTGNLVPFWSVDDRIYQTGSDQTSWKHTPTACGTYGVPDAEQVSTYGSGCSARIIENGWVMDY